MCQMGYAEAVFKPVVGCAWEDVVCHAQLFESAKSLELSCIKNKSACWVESVASVDGIVDEFTMFDVVI